MVDINDVDFVAFIVDAISDAIFTTPGAPQAFERSMQWRAEATWFPT
jgi:hypothetical protein